MKDIKHQSKDEAEVSKQHLKSPKQQQKSQETRDDNGGGIRDTLSDEEVALDMALTLQEQEIAALQNKLRAKEQQCQALQEKLDRASSAGVGNKKTQQQQQQQQLGMQYEVRAKNRIIQEQAKQHEIKVREYQTRLEEQEQQILEQEIIIKGRDTKIQQLGFGLLS